MQAKTVACKSYRSDRNKEDFHKELNNLSYLKEGLIEGRKKIMLHIAAIVQGEDFMILLPLAELRDLDIFLRGGFNTMDDTRDQEEVYSFKNEFPGMMPPNSNLHAALLKEITDLVSALVWLHEDLRIPGARDTYCAHMDLKPGNILITRDPSHIVGRWKICDFGISLFKKSTNMKALEVHSIRDVGPRLSSRAYQEQVIRGRGPYEPPEVSNVRVDGRKCDVWSIGCVLSEVIEFALGGKQAVDEFRRLRFSPTPFQGADDYFYQTKACIEIEPHSRDSNNTEVKSQIIEWFAERSVASSSPWIRECMDLLKKLLVIDPSQRATARETLEELDNIESELALDHGHRMAKTDVTDSTATIQEQGMGAPLFIQRHKAEG